MKSNATMRTLARAMAVDEGSKTYIDKDGVKYAAYMLEKPSLMALFESQGFRTDGVTWINMIARWKILGEMTPSPEYMKTMNGWHVIFTGFPEEDLHRLKCYAAYNEIGRVIE